LVVHPLPGSLCCLPPVGRFGIGIFYVLLYMLLKVAFDGAGWLVQIGNVIQLLYLFLIIVQVGGVGCKLLARLGADGGLVRQSPSVARRIGQVAALLPAHLPASCSPALSLPALARPQLVINLKNKPEAVEKIHSFCAIYFCLYMLVFTGVSIRCARTRSGGAHRQPAGQAVPTAGLLPVAAAVCTVQCMLTTRLLLSPACC